MYYYQLGSHIIKKYYNVFPEDGTVSKRPQRDIIQHGIYITLMLSVNKMHTKCKS